MINFTGRKVVNMHKQVSGVYKLMFVHISNNSRASTTLQAAAGGFIIAYLIRCFRPIAYQVRIRLNLFFNIVIYVKEQCKADAD